jgi:hypothetical protein
VYIKLIYVKRNIEYKTEAQREKLLFFVFMTNHVAIISFVERVGEK